MKLRIALFLIYLAAFSRLLPHPPNFTAMGALGLFGAAYLNRRWMAYLVPFVAIFLSDLFLNNVLLREYFPEFTWFTSVWTYIAFAGVVFTGRVLLAGKVTAGRVVAGSLTASVVFFLLSNFGVWFEGGMYPKTAAGLVACYTAALPFFGNTLLGDLLFSAALFGSFAWISRRIPQTTEING